MWNFTRTRTTAGNICLVLFTAFLFTILVSPFAMVGNAEAALVGTGNEKVTAYETDLEYDDYAFLVQLAVNDPLTDFDSIRVDFVDKDGVIFSVYGGDFSKTYVTNSVYGAVYQLVYDVPATFSVPVSNQVYGTVYVDSIPLYNVIISLSTPPDESGDDDDDDGGGGGSPGSPDTTVKVVKPVSDLVGSKAKEVSIKVGKISFVVPAGALDVKELADIIKADPNAKVSFNVKEVTPESVKLADKMGKTEFGNLKALGKVFDFEIIVLSGDNEVKISKFNKKLKVAIPYNDADLGGVKETRLIAARVTANGLVLLGGDVDTDNNLVWFETDSFSNYTLMLRTVAFADIMSHWAKNDIELLSDNGIVKGMDYTMFAPDASITRAQFATLLVKALGLNEVKPATGTFKDVASTAWYYGTVETAAANGIVAGFNGSFNPDGKISRQEMAVMIAKALNVGGKSTSLTSEEAAQLLSKFSDSKQIAAWAKEGVAAAVKEGIITGRTADTFVGMANATRAEGTVMIKKNLDSLGKL